MRILKSYKWWNFKIPPLLAVIYYLLLFSDPSISFLQIFIYIGLFVITSIGIAGVGHVINDYYDLEQDLTVAKYNAVQSLSGIQRISLFILLLVIYWLPWVYLPLNWINLGLLILQLLLLISYSIPPIRLKEKGVAGVLADALYGYTIPVMVAYATFVQVGGGNYLIVQILVPILVIWSFTAGLRGIVNSQIQDINNDRKSKTKTLITRIGKDRALTIITRYLLPLEYISYVSIVILISLDVFYFWIGFFIYLFWKAFQVKYIWEPEIEPFDFSSNERVIRLFGYVFLTEFYQKWWPLFMLVALFLINPIYIILGLAHILLFKNGLVEFFFHEMRYIPSGINNFLHRKV